MNKLCKYVAELYSFKDEDFSNVYDEKNLHTLELTTKLFDLKNYIVYSYHNFDFAEPKFTYK
jgi:hypothetical protein